MQRPRTDLSGYPRKGMVARTNSALSSADELARAEMWIGALRGEANRKISEEGNWGIGPTASPRSGYPQLC